MGLLSGLGGLGLGGLEGMSLYEEPEKESKAEAGEQVKAAPVVVKESDFLFEKSYTCVSCGKEFKVLAVRTGKAKLQSVDVDLRPKYDNFEPLKYDVVMCPYCGCASLTRYWGNMTDTQRKNLREHISRAFKAKRYSSDVYTFDAAFERYQMALANSLVKQAKPSEKAYICLKAGWLLKAKADDLDPDMDNYEETKKSTLEQAEEYMKNALEGFVAARRSENFPICGMDESTLDYLLAALSVEAKEYDQAAKLVSSLLASKAVNSRMKEKALILKETIIKAKSN